MTKKEVTLHKLKIPLVEQEMILLFFPHKLTEYLKQFEMNNGFELKTIRSRSFLNAAYPEIISSNLSKRVSKGEEPWAYLELNTPTKTIRNLYVQFLKYLDIQLEQLKKDHLPEELYEEDVLSLTKSLSQCQESENYKMLMQSILSRSFIQTKPIFRNIPKWYCINNGNEWEVVSHPFTPNDTDAKEKRKKDKGKQKEHILSYVISPTVTKIEDGYVYADMHYSVTRWVHQSFGSSSLRYIPEKKEKEKRMIYFLFDTYNPNCFIGFQLTAYEKKVEFYQKKLTTDRLKTIGYTVDAESVAKEPSAFYPSNEGKCTALVPYRPEDKKGFNELNSGVSTRDKKELLDLCLVAFQGAVISVKTEEKETGFSVSPKNGGKVYPEMPKLVAQKLEDKTCPIFVYAKEETNVNHIIREAMNEFNLSDFQLKPKSNEFIFLESEEKPLLFHVYKRPKDIYQAVKGLVKEKDARKNERYANINVDKETKKEIDAQKTEIRGEEAKNHMDKLYELIKYRLAEETPYFSIAFKLKPWKQNLFGAIDLANDEKQAIKSRKEELESAFQKGEEVTYNLIEIGVWDDIDEELSGTEREKGYRAKKDKKTDPKKLIEKTLLTKNHITQMFHQETLDVNKMKNAISDLLVRKGFVTHFYGQYAPFFASYTVYTPVAFKTMQNRKYGYIFSISKLTEEGIRIKYKGTGWLTIEESIVYLTKQNQRKLFQESGFISFYENIIKLDDELNPLVFIDYLTHKFFNTSLSYDDRIPMAMYDTDASRSPVATVLDEKGVHTKGSVLALGDDGFYYSIAPKTPMDTGENKKFTKTDQNKTFVNRVVSKVEILNVEQSHKKDEIAQVFHLMRNLTLTYASFTNLPYTRHIFQYHKEFID